LLEPPWASLEPKRGPSGHLLKPTLSPFKKWLEPRCSPSSSRHWREPKR
jgi:hypothetical protein